MKKEVKEMRSGLGPKGRGGYGGADAPAMPKKPGSATENYVAGRSEAVRPPREPIASVQDPSLARTNPDEEALSPGLMATIPMMGGPVKRPSREELERRKAAVAAVLSGQADHMLAGMSGGMSAPATVGSQAAGLTPAQPSGMGAPPAEAPPTVSAANTIDPAQEQKMMEELYKIYGLRK